MHGTTMIFFGFAKWPHPLFFGFGKTNLVPLMIGRAANNAFPRP